MLLHFNLYFLNASPITVYWIEGKCLKMYIYLFFLFGMDDMSYAGNNNKIII